MLGGREKDAYRRIEDHDRRLLGNNPELYDVLADPGEQINLYDAQPRVARLMENELSFYSNRFVRGTAPAERLSAEQLRAADAVLRQLGYK